MPFLVRTGRLLIKDPVFLSTATAVTVCGFCDQGFLFFDEDCNSALVFVAGG